MESDQNPAIRTRIELLERLERDLRHKLEHCIPPVDQHRHELERVRSELSQAREPRKRAEDL